MEKEFVKYEQALALKELGFDEECLKIWEKTMLFTTLVNPEEFKRVVSERYTKAPTYSQAFRWFREKYELHSFIDCKWKNLGWEFELVDLSKMETISSIDRYNYKTFEEAELACLEKLIEIVEQYKS